MGTEAARQGIGVRCAGDRRSRGTSGLPGRGRNGDQKMPLVDESDGLGIDGPHLRGHGPFGL